MKPYSSWLDNLKLKASYGAVGNDNLGTYYAYQGLYATGMNNYRDPGVMVSRLSNKDLKWETNLQFNVGLDFAVFNKLSGSVEWFSRKSKDLLFTLPMAPSTGMSGIDRNIGDVKNQGVEFSLNYAAISNKDFKWTIDLNGTSYKNRITKLPQAEVNAGVFKWREGESRYNFWGIEYAGVNPETGNDQYWKTIYETNDQGEKVVKERVKTENYNEVTSDSQQKYLGDAIPKLFGGFTNNFSYKGIDLSFMIYYSIGGKLYDSDYAQSMYYRRGYSMHPDMLDSLIDPHSAKGAYKKHPQVFQRHFLFYREERHDPEHHTGESHAHDRKTFGGNVCRQQIFGYRHVDGKQDIGYQYQDVTFQFLAVHDKCSYL